MPSEEDTPFPLTMQIAKGNKAVVPLDVLPGVRSHRKIGNPKGLMLSMADDFDWEQRFSDCQKALVRPRKFIDKGDSNTPMSLP